MVVLIESSGFLYSAALVWHFVVLFWPSHIQSSHTKDDYCNNLLRCLYICLWYNTNIQEVVSYFGDLSFTLNGFLPKCFCNTTLILLETIDFSELYGSSGCWPTSSFRIRIHLLLLLLTSLWHWYPNASRFSSCTMPVFTNRLKFYPWNAY